MGIHDPWAWEGPQESDPPTRRVQLHTAPEPEPALDGASGHESGWARTREYVRAMTRGTAPAVVVEEWVTEDHLRVLFDRNAEEVRTSWSWRSGVLLAYLVLTTAFVAVVAWAARLHETSLVGWLYLGASLLSVVVLWWDVVLARTAKQAASVCSAIEARWGSSNGTFRFLSERSVGLTLVVRVLAAVLALLFFCLGLAALA